VLCSLQDHLKTEMHDLDHPVLAGAKNTNNWRVRKAGLQRAFPLEVMMVPSSAIAITVDGEHLTCGGFSLGETICLGNFEFTADYFDGLSLAPRRGDAGAIFMVSTRSGASTPRWAMIGDSAEEFLTAPSGEGSFGLPSPRMCGTGALLAPITITPQMENAAATQATMMVPPRMAVPRPKTRLPSE
jgi:hypothetical protein